MAQAVSVFIELGDGTQFDLNNYGVISMSFERFNSIDNRVILNDLDLVLFDSTGNDLLPILLDNEKGKLKLRYGFTSTIGSKDKVINEERLSPVFTFNIVKIKPRWTNRAVTVAIRAYGTQIQSTSEPRYYPEGTPIKDVLIDLAKLNNWDTGVNHINIDDQKLKLPRNIMKSAEENDFIFILNKILPIVEHAFISRTDSFNSFFEAKLIANTFGLTELHFKPRANATRKVWKYEIGTSLYSEVIDCTVDIDLSSLLNGIIIKMPRTELDFVILDEDQAQTKYEEYFLQQLDNIKEQLDRHNIPMILPDTLPLRIQIVPPEGDNPALVGLSPEERILKTVNDTMKLISTAKLVVVGNPYIMQNDLIELDIRNINGTPNIISSGNSGSYWEVLRINEVIGLDGYKTELTIARTTVNVISNKQNIIKTNTGAINNVGREIKRMEED